MQRVTPIAWAALLAGMFALGLTFDSIAGWTSAYNTTAIAEACNLSTDSTACAALASAEATATIARWTRIDAILSVGAGLAAIFAFLAYREAKRQADIAERSLQHTEEASNRQYELLVNQQSAMLCVRRIGIESNIDLEHSLFAALIDIHTENIGATNASSIIVKAEVSVTIESAPSLPPVASLESADVPDVIPAGQKTLHPLSGHDELDVSETTADTVFVLMIDIDLHWNNFAGQRTTKSYRAIRRSGAGRREFGKIDFWPMKRLRQ